MFEALWFFKGVEVDSERIMQRAGAVTEARGLVCDAACGGVGFGLIVRRARYYPRLSAIICPMQRSNSSRCFVTTTCTVSGSISPR